MLNAPDGGWAPPSRPPNPAAQLSWRVLHSWWLLLPVLGLGCLGGIGFIFIGLRAKRPSWWVPGIAYLLLSCGSMTLSGQYPKTNPVSDVGVGVWLAVWLACIVHACLVNSAWLQWQAHYVPWYAEPSAPPPTWQGAAAPLPPAMQPQPGAYYAPGPPAAAPFEAAAYARPAVVDVNAATAEELAQLPGFDLDRARRTVAERQNRSGFANLDDFAFAAGLAPHQFAPLRAQLTCNPPTTPPPWHPPQGRVLDV
jgi:hypothetical protein